MSYNKKPRALAWRIVASWPCLEGDAINPRGASESKKRKPDKCNWRSK